MIGELPPAVRVVGDDMIVRFDQFHIPAYELFLKIKKLPESKLEYDYDRDCYIISAPARYASMLGVAVPTPAVSDLPFSPFLKDDQLFIVALALQAKRFAIWKDCGLGKTVESLELARHIIHKTGGRGLILTLNEVVDQTIGEAKKWYGDSLPIIRLNDRDEMRRWCKQGPGHLAISNYEKMNPDDEGQEIPELRYLTFLHVDESSRLKTGGGKQKWALIKSSKGIEYKHSFTATPAPNALMEFASQAAFLEKMRSEEDIIWSYFTRDPVSHRWTVKKHARQAFFEWMAGWSIYVRDPRRFGWRLNDPPVPDPEMFEHIIQPTLEQRQRIFEANIDEDNNLQLFSHKSTNTVQRAKLSQIAKGFEYVGKGEDRVRLIPSLKPAYVVDLIKAEMAAGLQVLVWTVFDAETDILAQLLKNAGITADVLVGKVDKPDRIPILERFRLGKSPLLIGRASMIGYGQNFQECGSMIFNGWNDSFEQFYQAWRRAVRTGQTKKVRIHIPMIQELEGATFDNLMRKQAEFEAGIAEMEGNYLLAHQTIGTIKAA